MDPAGLWKWTFEFGNSYYFGRDQSQVTAHTAIARDVVPVMAEADADEAVKAMTEAK